MTRIKQQNGFILMPVVIAIVLVATIAFLLNNQSAINTNTLGGESQGQQARYVAEAGINHALWLTNSSNCTGYPNPLNDSFGVHTYTASVSPSSGSPVSITASGTLLSGASRNLTRNAVRIYQPPIITALQPDATEAIDTFIDSFKSTWNHGVHALLRVRGGGTTRYSLLKFDLTAIPTSASVTSATLELYLKAKNGSSDPVNVHRMSTSWGEGDKGGSTGLGATWNDSDTGVSWTTAGGDYEAAASASSSISIAANNWQAWDVTGLVTGWVAGNYTNDGMILLPGSTSVDNGFASSDDTDPTIHPRLTITYACECGVSGTPGSATLQPGAEGKDTFLNSFGSRSDASYGGDNLITVAESSAKHGLLEFDLSTIPAGAVVNSAQLDLYAVSNPNNGSVLSAYRLTNSWLEGTTSAPSASTDGASWDKYDAINSWTTAGGDYVSTPVSQTTITGASSWISMDVSALVAGWVDGSNPNFGVLLKAGSGFGSANFDSSDSAIASQHPKLTINYTCPCGVDCSGGGGGASCTTFTDNFEVAAFNNNDGTGSWSGDWIELDGSGTGASSGKAMISGGEMQLRGTPSGNDPSLAREADLSSFATATLSFDYRTGGGVEAGEDSVVVEVSGDGGGSWIVLEDFINEVANAAGSRSYDISAFIAINTQVRFRINAAYGGPDEYFYVDNLVVAGDCGPPLAPAGLIAHWKLDETSGSAAVDSVGGHDGTLINWPASPDWVTGQLDGGLSFDGANDYIDVSSMNPMSYDDFTVSAWYRSADSSVSDDEYIFEHNDNWVEEVTFGPTDDGSGDRLRFGFSSGGAGTWDPHYGTSDIVDQLWHHVVGVRSSGRIKLYVDSVKEADGADAHAGLTITIDGDGPFIGDLPGNTEQVHGLLDDVRLYDRALTDAEISALFAAGGGGGGGSPGYNEAYAQWSATSNGTWQTMDLATFGVPANAVVEVAVVNSNTSRQYWGGVRQVGSSLDRRLQLHEAESGGTDVMAMTVQADASSQIEHYSDTPSDVTFILLGYWGSGSFVENWDFFNAGVGNSWIDHALNAYGVAPGAVAEILVHNDTQSTEYTGGVRTNGSTAQRVFDVHEPEGGGKDMLTLLVTADTDSGATIEVFAESDSSIDFYLLGHWSTPPGVYTETYVELLGSPASSSAWEDKDLSSLGVPANSVVQIVTANGEDTAEAKLGVREKGSSLERSLNLQEAEAGGDDLGSMHVNTDASAIIQWYDQDTSQDHRFYLLGWWVLP